ncbi:ribosome-associated protein [Litorimonas taeanensis]|uniref:Ribosomal silencing factor RsfS n=1 Tax=Litorimonas taeanensis TaxID=568099 RepID=A0A420WJ22_9PROT|nr:ribosome-associated protein [Litorimonas taeanensis]
MESLLSTQRVVTTPSPSKSSAKSQKAAKALSDFLQHVLDENSAQDVIEIDIRGKSSVADYMLVASGRSNRHVSALSDYVLRALKEEGYKDIGVEGQEGCDWVLVDVGDVILHIFRPEVRVFYNIEKIWSVPLPDGLQNIAEEAPSDPE